MKDLNRYVVKRYATDWYDIGIELGLELDVLDIIKKDNCQECVTCFQKTLNKWLQLNSDDTTWKTIEIALTNINRTNLGLNPVDDGCSYTESNKGTYISIITKYVCSIVVYGKNISMGASYPQKLAT